MNNTNSEFKFSSLLLAISTALLFSNNSYAENIRTDSLNYGIEKIEVTASRRSTDIQNTSLNISVIDDEIIEDFNVTQLSDIAKWIPSLTITDQGGRYDSPIIVRGLNTDTSGPASDGGTVATYLGDVPLAVDLKLIDIKRIEALIGPQGTLYGAGTLAGAIRYIPNKPELDFTSGSVSGDISSLSHSNDTGTKVGFVFNKPLIDNKLAFRVAASHDRQAGFIDYNHVLQTSGTSIADVNWTNQTAINNNQISIKDANDENNLNAKAMLRWLPFDNTDATLSYHFQKEEVNGRSLSHYQSLNNNNLLNDLIGKYDSAYRYQEPVERKTSLLSLEIISDFSFAQLTSATGWSELTSQGSRDQSDFFIQLEADYEEFPAFSAFAKDNEKQESFTQELRLVSKTKSAFSWIAGAYYSDYKYSEQSKEITPGYSNFRLSNPLWVYREEIDDYELVLADQIRPDNIDYISDANVKTKEKAIFGELTLQASEKLALTVGARFYSYQNEYGAATDFPLFDTLYYGRPADEIYLDFETEKTKAHGNLFKFNANYQLSDSLLTYFTASEGFRLGGSNGLARCSNDENQFVCASENEFSFKPDTTKNIELGLKSNWLNNRLTFNAAIFNITWNDAQLGSETTIGFVPIIVNAGKAQSQGFELSSRAKFNNHLIAFANYSYTDAEISEQPEQGILPNVKKHDRLPGSPREQFSLGLQYNTELSKQLLLDINYGLTYQSDVYSSIGLVNYGEVIPSYSLHNISATLSKNNWKTSLYINNIFDKYAYSSVRNDKGVIGRSDEENISRYYGHYIVRPMEVGLKFTYMFAL